MQSVLTIICKHKGGQGRQTCSQEPQWNVWAQALVLLLLATVDVAARDCAFRKVLIAKFPWVSVFANFRLALFALAITLLVTAFVTLHL